MRSRAGDAIYELCEVRVDGTDASAGGLRRGADNLFGLRESLTGKPLLVELLKGYCWAISAITLRRDLLQRTGLFDPEKRIAEDCDLWFRVAALGKVLAGDLATPVSVYWRHANNTYRYELRHRVALLRAMLDAWRWSELSGVQVERLDALREQVPKYALRSMVAAREAGSPGMALRIIALMLRRRRFRFLFSRNVLRQAAAACKDAMVGGRV